MKTLIASVTLLTVGIMSCGCSTQSVFRPLDDLLNPLSGPLHDVFGARPSAHDLFMGGFDRHVTTSLINAGKYCPEAFQRIEKAYRLDGDCVLVFSTVDRKSDERKKHWLRLTPIMLPPEMTPDRFSITIAPERLNEGDLPPDVVDRAPRIGVLDSGANSAQSIEPIESDMYVTAKPSEKSYILSWADEGILQSTHYRFSLPSKIRPEAKPFIAMGYPFAVGADAFRHVAPRALYLLGQGVIGVGTALAASGYSSYPAYFGYYGHSGHYGYCP